MLQDSLCGSSKVLLVANISPESTSGSETLSSLNFASRAAQVRRAGFTADAPAAVCVVTAVRAAEVGRTQALAWQPHTPCAIVMHPPIWLHPTRCMAGWEWLRVHLARCSSPLRACAAVARCAPLRCAVQVELGAARRSSSSSSSLTTPERSPAPEPRSSVGAGGGRERPSASPAMPPLPIMNGTAAKVRAQAGMRASHHAPQANPRG